MFKLTLARLRGMLDYLFGIALVATTWLLKFDGNRNATLASVIVGLTVIIYCLLTNHEPGIVHLIEEQTRTEIVAASKPPLLQLTAMPVSLPAHAGVSVQ